MAYHAADYDVVVVGTGHAGVEAALAAARMGCRTLALTTNLDNVALMSCNPSIGGPAKGHLVREIDALGGQMALAADAAFTQMRMLNTGKGAAVQALRALVDKRAYQAHMKRALEAQSGLDYKQGMVQDIVVEGGRVRGVVTKNGLFYGARAVVLTTGTYLEGLVITGDKSLPSGPAGQLPAVGLSAGLQRLGLRMGRFKTGTPMRLDGRSVDYGALQRLDGDERPWRFSFLSSPKPREQLPGWLTYTNERTHALIRANLHRAPLYNGLIRGTGPRYCPSVEDKVVRFAERSQHQVVLEHEGRDTCEMYVLGLSTSLPEEVQVEMVRSVRGLERAEIMRPGYAIEYDYLLPTQLTRWLEVKAVPGLFSAGQINGSSGYEEAAAQGLVAGANAALQVQGREPLVFSRAEAYIGVLIDDLVTKGVQEPYRLLTSRAEYRLLLRQENADLRLTEKGRQAGLVDENRYYVYLGRKEAVAAELDRLQRVTSKGVPAAQLLKRPEVTYATLVEMGLGDPALPAGVSEEVETQIRYEGYVQREAALIARMERLEGRRIPPGIDYGGLRGLSREAAEKLAAVQPETVGQASRVPGVSPADIALLLVHLEALRAPARGQAAD